MENLVVENQLFSDRSDSSQDIAQVKLYEFNCIINNNIHDFIN